MIDHIDGRRAHVFECSTKVCKGKGKNGRHIWWYLGTADATSTSNLRWHAKICWSAETVAAADNMHDVHAARGVLAKAIQRDGSIEVFTLPPLFLIESSRNPTIPTRNTRIPGGSYHSYQEFLPANTD